MVFVGPSGCGKTTLMRMVGGLETPSAGAIHLEGREVTGPSREKGMVFQSYSSFPWLTVLGNVRFGLKYRRDLSAAEKDRIARHYLELVKLTPFADFYVNRISGGMRQRVAIARTLAADPLVLLMDEPFGALDALARERLQLQLLELQKAERKTVIFVTHDVDEAVFLADRIIVFSARPARVLRDLRVGAVLSPERTLDIQESAAFRRMRHEVLALIRDEERRTEAAELAAGVLSAAGPMGAFDFTGKRVLVTGASHGIGFAVARAFARAGAELAILSSTADIDDAGRADRGRERPAGARPDLRHHRPRGGTARSRRAWRARRARQQCRARAAHADPRAGRRGRADLRADHRDQRDRHLLRHPRGGAADGPRRQHRADLVDLGPDRGGRVLRLRRLQARQHRLHAGAREGARAARASASTRSARAGSGRAPRCARSRSSRPAPA